MFHLQPIFWLLALQITFYGSSHSQDACSTLFWHHSQRKDMHITIKKKRLRGLKSRLTKRVAMLGVQNHLPEHMCWLCLRVGCGITFFIEFVFPLKVFPFYWLFLFCPLGHQLDNFIVIFYGLLTILSAIVASLVLAAFGSTVCPFGSFVLLHRPRQRSGLTLLSMSLSTSSLLLI